MAFLGNPSSKCSNLRPPRLHWTCTPPDIDVERPHWLPASIAAPPLSVRAVAVGRCGHGNLAADRAKPSWILQISIMGPYRRLNVSPGGILFDDLARPVLDISRHRPILASAMPCSQGGGREVDLEPCPVLPVRHPRTDRETCLGAERKRYAAASRSTTCWSGGLVGHKYRIEVEEITMNANLVGRCNAHPDALRAIVPPHARLRPNHPTAMVRFPKQYL